MTPLEAIPSPYSTLRWRRLADPPWSLSLAEQVHLVRTRQVSPVELAETILQPHRRFLPEEDDVVVERLRSAGAVILGKTNVPVFGFGPGSTNAVYGQTCNPWNTARTPGGSSGGSAAAVAMGMGSAALGSDGGGSIRVPSSFCGVFGLKPSFGRVPPYPGCRDERFAGFSAWESIEPIGPIAR